jgi:hypothetical protein
VATHPATRPWVRPARQRPFLPPTAARRAQASMVRRILALPDISSFFPPFTVLRLGATSRICATGGLRGEALPPNIRR